MYVKISNFPANKSLHNIDTVTLLFTFLIDSKKFKLPGTKLIIISPKTGYNDSFFDQTQTLKMIKHKDS